MIRLRAFLLALIALVLVGTGKKASATKPVNHSSYAPGEVVVKLRPDAPQFEIADLNERLMTIARLAGEQSAKTTERAAEPLVRTTGSPRISRIISERGLDRVFVIKLDQNSDVEQIVNEFRARDDVEYAEPNYLVTFGSVIPNDPKFWEQWPLLNSGDTLSECNPNYYPTANADIKAYQAWDLTVGSPDVIIAVVDTGIDLTHPDLVRNIYTNPGEIAGNGIDDDHNGYVDDVHGYNVAEQNGDTSDAVGHGTQIAGIIAAEMNNRIGIAGVCQSKILPVRFYRRFGPGPTQYDATIADAARGLVYSIVAGASIINASWRTLLNASDTTEQDARVLQDAVQATNDAGVLLVCIAGNEGFNLDYSRIYPASYGLPNEIVVAASDFNDEVWHPVGDPYTIETGFGPRSVDLAAPGVSVLTTKAHGNCFLCSDEIDPSKWYTCADGTSISAAFVSGVAGLVKSKYPDDNAIIIKRRILAGVQASDNLRDYVITGGRLSAIGALQAQVKITPPFLQDIAYKAKSEKFTVYGSGMQEGVTVIVGNKGYSTKPRSNDGTAFLARVPSSALPPGVAVPIKVRNPDGGESKVLMLTR
ncbi:MAG TPA: S8 family serine peptidase [Blastocatellia bacterium]